MNLRKLVLLSLGLLVAFSATVQAADWPSKPVRIIVSFPPGGSSDLVARLLSTHLTDKFGKQFVVENKPGAGGTVAATALKERKRRWTHVHAVQSGALFDRTDSFPQIAL